MLVRALGIWIFEPDRSCLWVTWWTLGGTKFFKYAGTSLWTILKNVTILCLYLLCSRLSHPVSSRSLLFEHDLVAPVTILAASYCTLSISSFFSFRAVVPNCISILQSWPNKRYVNSFQSFSIKFIHKWPKDIYSFPSFRCNIKDVFIPWACFIDY